ncbi:MAG: isochorismatase family protein [Fibrobacteria bacterium]|nr:isochorismatase family protein [Fibrobacteria bacterium]
MILPTTLALALFHAPLPVREAADTVVLLVDFQHDFASPDGAWPADPQLSREVLRNATNLVETAHSRGWSVVRVANAFSKWDPGNIFRHYAAIRGTPGARWILPDTTRQGPLFPKTSPDGFCSKGLNSWFEDHPGSVIWIAGFFAHGCVQATASSALCLGHTVLSSPSLIASPDSLDWKDGWKCMKEAGVVEAEVPGSDEGASRVGGVGGKGW